MASSTRSCGRLRGVSPSDIPSTVPICFERGPGREIGDTVAMVTSAELEAAAAAARADLGLDELLETLGEPHLVGSAALGLMVWPDLDMTVVCDQLDVEVLHGAATELVRHPRVRQLTFRNDSGHWNRETDKYPDGIYWGIDYRDGERV